MSLLIQEAIEEGRVPLQLLSLDHARDCDGIYKGRKGINSTGFCACARDKGISVLGGEQVHREVWLLVRIVHLELQLLNAPAVCHQLCIHHEWSLSS